MLHPHAGHKPRTLDFAEAAALPLVTITAWESLLVPRGEVVAIDEPPNLDLLPLKEKSQTWHWELMFTRPLFEPGSTTQADLLDEVARMVDAGTPLRTRIDGLTPENPREAHRMVESGGTIGKVVLDAS